MMQNAAMNTMAMGQRLVAIDPKNDFAKVHRVFPNVKVIDLCHVQPGSLNPFEFLKKINPDTNQLEYLDEMTLLTIIQLLVGTKKMSTEAENAITPIIRDYVLKAKNGESVNLYRLAEYLYSKDNMYAQNIGQTMKSYVDSNVGKLLFNTEDVKPLVISNTDSLVISLMGMKLPSYDTKIEDYSMEDNLTTAIVYIITKKLREMLLRPNKIPVLFICDEAHMLFGNKEMSKVIDEFLVLGRSLGVSTMLASQGITHFPEGISNYITSKFLFKSSLDESKEFFRRFDTSKDDPTNRITDSIVTAIPKLPQGVCFFMDRFDRNGIIHITSLYPPEVFEGEFVPGENFVLR